MGGCGVLVERADLLGLALFADGKVGLLQAVDVFAGAVGDDDVYDDEVGAGLDGRGLGGGACRWCGVGGRGGVLGGWGWWLRGGRLGEGCGAEEERGKQRSEEVRG